MTRAPKLDGLLGFVLEVGGDTLVVLSLPVRRLDLASLTPVQRAVVEDVVHGHSNAEIARRRGCSPRTIANHLAAAFRKLGVGSRFELVARLSRGA